jgi:hypothetical protein
MREPSREINSVSPIFGAGEALEVFRLDPLVDDDGGSTGDEKAVSNVSLVHLYT